MRKPAQFDQRTSNFGDFSVILGKQLVFTQPLRSADVAETDLPSSE